VAVRQDLFELEQEVNPQRSKSLTNSTAFECPTDSE
jgi:hypothetical protein